jgi:two-component system response regulator AtoC
MSRNVLRRPELEVVDFFGMITVSPQMREFFDLIGRVARTDSSILIRGETGTGKELVANAVHQLSRRAGGPFRAVNCATFTPELLASELFGHVRGAFTGAIRDRQGLFASASSGTVFLDEIAEMPLDLQARILRVVQEKNFVPVGGTDPIEVDVRLVSATHRALRREVEEGRFREDLMYRLRVVPIFLPRLVEREGDIEALLWHFIDEFNAVSERQLEGVEEDAMKLLLDYDWPGNIRELHNVVEYAFAVGTDPVLTAGDLMPEMRGEPPPPSQGGRSPEEKERAEIIDALEKAGGRKSKAAELLGISRSTLWRKLREYHIG